MSVVAVKITKSEIVIGADSIRVYGYTQFKDSLAKLFEIEKGYVLGAAGKAQTAVLFYEFLKNHTAKYNNVDGVLALVTEFARHLKTVDAKLELADSVFLLVYKGKVYLIQNFFVNEVKEYMAIGAGMDFALAVLYVGESVRKALEAACHLSIYCERPIRTISIKV